MALTLPTFEQLAMLPTPRLLAWGAMRTERLIRAAEAALPANPRALRDARVAIGRGRNALAAAQGLPHTPGYDILRGGDPPYPMGSDLDLQDLQRRAAETWPTYTGGNLAAAASAAGSACIRIARGDDVPRALAVLFGVGLAGQEIPQMTAVMAEILSVELA